MQYLRRGQLRGLFRYDGVYHHLPRLDVIVTLDAVQHAVLRGAGALKADLPFRGKGDKSYILSSASDQDASALRVHWFTSDPFMRGG